MSRFLVVATLATLIVTAVSAKTGVCKGCHGKHFEKKALGKSKVVKDMTKKEIISALKGYKSGTYGGAMKGIMQKQLIKYSDADFDKLVAEIKK